VRVPNSNAPSSSPSPRVSQREKEPFREGEDISSITFVKNCTNLSKCATLGALRFQHFRIVQVDGFAVHEVENIRHRLFVALLKDFHRGVTAVGEEDGVIETT
jgi:hypothetical protein